MLTQSTLGTSFSNAFNAIYVDTVDTKHIHTFLPITFLIWIFNPQKNLKSWDSGLFNHTIKYYICRYCQYKTRISNAFNAIYVNTVDTVFTPHSTLYKVLCKSHKHQCRQCWQTKHWMHCVLWSLYWQCRQTRYPTQYTIALLWSFVLTISTCLHVHLNYNADSNMKSSNYRKIRFKALIYFELQQSSN